MGLNDEVLQEWSRVVGRLIANAPEQGEWPWEDHCEGVALHIAPQIPRDLLLRVAGQPEMVDLIERADAERDHALDALAAMSTSLVHIGWRNERSGAFHARKMDFERHQGPGWVKVYAYLSDIEAARERLGKRSRPT